jgi:hypothetical protein
MAYIDKLQEGQRKLAKAGHDRDLLQSALLSFHGALEDYFREELRSEISQLEQDTGKQRANWQDLVNLWEQYRSLSSHDKNLILATNSKRNDAAHGASVPITQTEVEHYARFVQNFTGTRVSDPIPVTNLQRHAHVKQAASTPVKRPSPPANARGTKQKVSCLGLLARLLMVLMIVCVALYLGAAYLLSQGGQVDDANDFSPLQIFRNTINSIPDESSEKSEEETAVPMPDLPSSDPSASITTIQVTGNSYIRSGPGLEFDIIGTVIDKEIYEVLEISDANHWYKIKLASGQEGWLGSTRAVQILP